MTTPAPPPIGASPFRLRRWSLAHEVRPLIERIFSERPEVNSVLMAVAQYWADEADDAVHGHLVMSARQTPRWPHRCGDGPHAGDGDLCSYCCARDFDDPRARWVSWDENGLAIRCWQAFCHEGATQEEDPNFTSVPVVLARRGMDGAVLDLVGRTIRPWLDLPTTGLPTWFQQVDTAASLEPVVVPVRSDDEAPFREAIARSPFDDGPRLVFADWLQQREDPLGEFISLSLSPQRTPATVARRRALLHDHAEAWLGPLVHVVSSGSADFSRGLLTKASVCFDESTLGLASLPQWSTVEHLDFASTSRIAFSEKMTALRSVSGLRREAVGALPTTVTDVACGIEAVRGGLPAHVTSLTLTVPFEESAFEALRSVVNGSVWNHLESFALGLEPTLADEDAERPFALVEEVLGLRRRPTGPARVAVGGWSSGHRRTGWWLEHRRDAPTHAQLSFEGFSAFESTAIRNRLVSVAGAGGVKALRVVANDWWSVSVEDEQVLSRSGVRVEVVGASLTPEPPPLPQPERRPAPPIQVVVDPISRAAFMPAPASTNRPSTSGKRGRSWWLEALVLAALAAAVLSKACTGS